MVPIIEGHALYFWIIISVLSSCQCSSCIWFSKGCDGNSTQPHQGHSCTLWTRSLWIRTYWLWRVSVKIIIFVPPTCSPSYYRYRYGCYTFDVMYLQEKRLRFESCKSLFPGFSFVITKFEYITAKIDPNVILYTLNGLTNYDLVPAAVHSQFGWKKACRALQSLKKRCFLMKASYF